jgi:ribosomal protein S12 methylthiotransferase
LFELVDELSLIADLKWIRIMYAHPKTFDMRILELMKERKNICRYIDIPLQHIDNDILNKMKRGANTENKIKKLIEEIRKIIPEICIRSTFITGFPSENNKQHKNLLNFLSDTKINRVGVFKYSQEDGTFAANMQQQITNATNQKRYDELMTLQQNISLELNQKLVGKNINVLIEEDYNDDYFVGRSEFDAPDIDNNVFIKKQKISNENSVKIGDIIRCRVVDAEHYSLYVEAEVE